MTLLNATSGALDELDRLENDDADTEGLIRISPTPVFPAGSGLGSSDDGELETLSEPDSTEVPSFMADA